MFRDRSGNSLILFSLLVDYGNLLALDLRGHGPLAAHRGDIDCIGGLRMILPILLSILRA